jgi:hypothetical protein
LYSVKASRDNESEFPPRLPVVVKVARNYRRLAVWTRKSTGVDRFRPTVLADYEKDAVLEFPRPNKGALKNAT